MPEQNKFPAHRAIGFLLAQVGAHATRRFGERLAPLSLKPSDAGIIRLLGQTAGMSQQALASTLGIHASRLVAVVDDLEARGLVTRQPNTEDRRTYALQLTEKGRAALLDIGRIAREHNDALCATLTTDERELLGRLLQRIAEQEGLSTGVHPGYAGMGSRPGPPR